MKVASLERVWGASGALRPVVTLRDQFASLVDEFLVSFEVKETAEAVCEMEVRPITYIAAFHSFFHFSSIFFEPFLRYFSGILQIGAESSNVASGVFGNV